MKVVINKCYGGYSLSEAVYKELGIEWDGYGFGTKYNLERNDPKLIAAVEKLGETANGSYAKLEIVEIPDDIDWEIEEYDGMEWVSEVHRTWG